MAVRWFQRRLVLNLRASKDRLATNFSSFSTIVVSRAETDRRRCVNVYEWKIETRLQFIEFNTLSNRLDLVKALILRNNIQKLLLFECFKLAYPVSYQKSSYSKPNKGMPDARAWFIVFHSFLMHPVLNLL